MPRPTTRSGALALALGLTAATLAAPVAATAADPEDTAGVDVDRDIETPLVTESSGLARSTYDRALLWTHNDEGDGPRIYGIGSLGRLRSVVQLRGATNQDWEDIASGPGHDLWVGDIGDTSWTRPTVSVYRLTEPEALEDATLSAQRYELTYPDGARNSGALLVHPDTGRLYLVSRVQGGGAVYAAPANLSEDSVNRMTRVADAPAGISAGSFAPDGNSMVLAAAGKAYLYDHFGDEPVTIPTPPLPHPDSAEISRNGNVLLVGTEGADSSVYAVQLPGDSGPEDPEPVDPTPPPPTPPAANPAGGTTLESATWDALATGPLNAEEFNSQLPGANKNEAPYDDSSIAADSRGSGKVYRLTLDAGSMHRYPSGNNGIVTFIPMAQKVDDACLSYEIRFSPGFDWSLGGKLPGLSGVRPGTSASLPTGGGNPGDQGWSGRLMWLGPEAYGWAGPTNEAVTYMYGPKQTEYYGDNYRWHEPFVAGQWHAVRVCYRMNSVGSANGVLRAWMDGKQVLDVTNYVYRLRSDVHITHLNWSIFRGGASRDWAGSRDGFVDIDDVRITTN